MEEGSEICSYALLTIYQLNEISDEISLSRALSLSHTYTYTQVNTQPHTYTRTHVT